ncbi:MAG: 50S ribosomal protein L13 [Euryarchaeota archaeon]|nr:50S ribosomal protein L13 [Euryarchaeota archaeon]
MIVDGKNLILGRTASITAKKLLNGEKVVIVNAEKMVITGNKKNIFGRYKQRQELRNIANPRRGPHYPRTPERIVKRAVRGMLPYKKHMGRKALKRLRVHEGVPKEFKDQDTIKLNDATLNKEKTLKYRTIKELSKYLGN